MIKYRVLINVASLYILIISILLFGCQKDDGSNQAQRPQDAASLFELLNLDATSIVKQSFHYSSDKIPVKVVDTGWAYADPANKTFINSIELTLNGQQQPSMIVYTNYQHNVDHIVYFFKDAEHPMRIRYDYPGQPINFPEHWLSFDGKGRVIADTAYDRPAAHIKSIIHFTYDTNNNIIKSEQVSDNSPGVFITLYTYDQNPNPFYSPTIFHNFTKIAPFYPYFGKNNLLTETYVDQTNGTSQLSRTFTYEYNNDGLPVKRTLKTPTLYQFDAYNVEYRYK